MDSESELYDKLCFTFQCPVDDDIRRAFSTAQVTGEFNISGHTVDTQNCEIISQVLQKSKNVMKFNASDCILPPNGMTHIINSLQSLSSIREVNLHGNNIVMDTCTKLGKMLAINNSITVLILKWNNLGLSLESFSNFCDGLSKNESLESLDLRCNQICCEGAKYLASGLRPNKALKMLDLRWNKIESEGAEHLLEALQENKTLNHIKVEGNFVRKELSISLEQCVKHNISVQKLQTDCEARTSLLAKHIKTIEEKRVQQVNLIDQKTRKQIEEAEIKLCELTTNLGAKELKIKDLEEQLLVLQRNLNQEGQKKVSLEELLKEREKTNKAVIETNQSTIEALKKMLHERELQSLKYTNEMEEKLNDEKQSRQQFESELREQTEAAAKMRIELKIKKEEMDFAVKQHTETFEAEKDMWKKRFKELENSSEAALQRLRASSSDKQQSLENAIIELTEKQSGKLLLLSERVERLKEEKTMLETQLTSTQSTNSQLQRENSSLLNQLNEPTRKLASLLEEISNEKIFSQKLQHECQNEKRIVEDLRNELEKLRKELNSSKQKQLELEDKYEEELRQQKHKIKQLYSKLEERNKQIDVDRSEERERAKILYSAFNKYMGALNSPKKSSSPDN